MNVMTPEQIELAKPRFSKFLANANPVTGCIHFMGARSTHGYGNFTVDGVSRKASRVAWMMARGPIPDGLFVCHHCDNPPCCNPNHLFLGTNGENYWDSDGKNRVRRGENKFGSKLTEQQALAILKSDEQTSILSKQYGIDKATVRGIRARKYWKHLQIN